MKRSGLVFGIHYMILPVAVVMAMSLSAGQAWANPVSRSATCFGRILKGVRPAQMGYLESGVRNQIGQRSVPNPGRSISTLKVYKELDSLLEEKRELRKPEKARFCDLFSDFSRLRCRGRKGLLRLARLPGEFNEQLDRYSSVYSDECLLSLWPLEDTEISGVMAGYWDKRVFKASKQTDFDFISKYPLKHIELTEGVDSKAFLTLSKNKELRSLVVDKGIRSSSVTGLFTFNYDALLKLVRDPESQLEVLSVDGARITADQLVELIRQPTLKAISFNDVDDAFKLWSRKRKPEVDEILRSHPNLKVIKGEITDDADAAEVGAKSLFV